MKRKTDFDDVVDAHAFIYEVGNFGCSDREPTSMDKFIIGERPYYYLWEANTENETMYVILVNNLKIRMWKHTFYDGTKLIPLNLSVRKPAWIGQKAMKKICALSHRK